MYRFHFIYYQFAMYKRSMKLGRSRHVILLLFRSPSFFSVDTSVDSSYIERHLKVLWYAIIRFNNLTIETNSSLYSAVLPSVSLYSKNSNSYIILFIFRVAILKVTADKNCTETQVLSQLFLHFRKI